MFIHRLVIVSVYCVTATVYRAMVRWLFQEHISWTRECFSVLRRMQPAK